MPSRRRSPTTRSGGAGPRKPRRARPHLNSGPEDTGGGSEHMALGISEKAAKQVRMLMEAQKSENLFLRMGVKGGGCSGLSYSLEFDNELGPHDKKFELEGIPTVCDAKSYLYLNGTT